MLLDDAGGAPEDALEDAVPGDAFVAITFAPFSRLTDWLARRAAAAGAKVIAISETTAAPMQEVAGDLFFVAPTLSCAFPESAGAALAVANLLAALTVAKLGEAAHQVERTPARGLGRVPASWQALTRGGKWKGSRPVRRRGGFEVGLGRSARRGP
jgi:DNA-binding MurR/RpiR family transcriptional regulator